MKYRISEDRKAFKERVNGAASQERAHRLGLVSVCKAGRLEITLAWRYRKPQLKFLGTVSEEGELTGDIELCGKAWQWYDYCLLAVCCLLVVPYLIIVLVSSPAIFSSYGTPGIETAKGFFGLPFDSKKKQRKRLEAYLTETLGCIPEDEEG